MSAQPKPDGTMKASAVFIVTSLTLMAFSILAPSPANADPDGNIVNAAPGNLDFMVLDVVGGLTNNGQPLILYPENPMGAPWQQFDFRDMGGGRFEIVARHSGKCLDVYEWSLADGARVVQWDCHGGANQLWYLFPMTTPSLCGDPPSVPCTRITGTKFVSALSGRCLDAANGLWPQLTPPGEGAAIQQWGCARDQRDAWWINQTYVFL
jgi:hypothetical protein